MSVLAATLLGLGGLGVTVWFWRAAPRDLEIHGEGAPPLSGHQGRCVEWMDTVALQPPRPPTAWYGHADNPSDRVLYAMLNTQDPEAKGDVKEVHERLRARHQDGVASAFVRGRFSAATRIAARRHFHGPPALFLPWYWLIFRIRRGPRGVHLETLYQALEETRS